MSIGAVIVMIVLIVCVTALIMQRAENKSDLRKASDKALDGALEAERDEALKELQDLRERIKVLERIATDGHSLDATETRRIAAEIEALREKQDG